MIGAYREAIFTMERMSNECLGLPDEAPIRFLLLSCLEHQKPMSAVRIFNQSKKSLKMDINAATYGLYNKVLLDSSWPAKNRDGYTLWRLLRNVVMATTAFMKPLSQEGYKVFQAPIPASQWNLNMGVNHGSLAQGNSRSLDGVIEHSNDLNDPNKVRLVGCKTEASDETNTETLTEDPNGVISKDSVFEPRSESDSVPQSSQRTLKKSNSIIRPGSMDKDEENDTEITENETENNRSLTPKIEDLAVTDVDSEASYQLPKPDIPARTNGLPSTNGEVNANGNSGFSTPERRPTPLTSQTPEPPVIPAFPRNTSSGLFGTKSLSLPKSMSGKYDRDPDRL